MSHRNAPLTQTGRLRLARCVVEQWWPLRRAAERFQVSPGTAKRWADRYREHGAAGMVDRSSRPHTSPYRTPTRVERRIIKVRVIRRWGPARIAYHLGLNPSTVHRVLTRYGLARLAHLDRGSGRPVRRYERAMPGELVHVDIKKLGNIPDGGGHRVTDRTTANKHRKATTPARYAHGKPKIGYSYLHNAIDDHSRLAYSEILPDETKQTAVAFWQRAQAFFTQAGITVQRVLTDNGSCYKSFLWRDTLTAAGIQHKRTRPYRPQTNGKVERFNRTLLDEWAYATAYTCETERRNAFPQWLHTYNHHRGHTALGGLPPASRVPNLTGQYT
ncbi:MAG TPA: IS481 family transposase [Actinophytocola sp.]|uniref:IS481 family transposase n=1 Tax=Actinophytocola sp. TaxID=1872138 RepID=UPI002DDCC5FF|nr:IS481 family transposase [Actinophytocola sp.]HEV2781538.1 IS481 family transposase [Actinophytocola sp.]